MRLGARWRGAHNIELAEYRGSLKTEEKDGEIQKATHVAGDITMKVYRRVKDWI